MNNYETLFVIKPTLTDEETAAQIAKITEILEREGAQILATNKMGMRKLAYPVAKNERGVYTIIYFNAVGSVIAELERKLKFNEEVIKYLTVKYTKQKEIKQFNKLVAQSSVKEETAKAEEVTTQESPKAEEATTNSVEA